MKNKYKIADLMRRYGITTRQGVTKFVNTYLEEINADGVKHARKERGEWVFDEEAVATLDKLRDTNNITIIEEDSERIQELTAEVEQLKTLLIATQNKLVATQEQLLATKDELNDTQKQLSTATVKTLETSQQLAVTKVEDKAKDKRIEELEIQVAEGQKAFETVRQLRQRGLIDRILNR